MKKYKKIFATLAAAGTLAACTPAKKYNVIDIKALEKP